MTWLLPGRTPALIDAGAGDSRHIDALDGALGGERLAMVLVTHNHSDHASGAPAIRQRMPHVRFAKMPWPEKDPRYPVEWEPLADGDEVEAGDTTLQVVHTPGHAPDHVCFWHEPTRTLLSGDLAVQGTTIVIPASAQGDLAAYLASLERVLALDPARLLPAHGPVITNPAPLLRAYLVHRREREEQILDALRSGIDTVDAMVSTIYACLNDALVPSARDSVRAHLIKLEREGRARRANDEWHINDG